MRENWIVKGDYCVDDAPDHPVPAVPRSSSILRGTDYVLGIVLGDRYDAAIQSAFDLRRLDECRLRHEHRAHLSAGAMMIRAARVLLVSIISLHFASPAFAQDAASFGNLLSAATTILGGEKACSSLSRFQERSRDLQRWAQDPALGIEMARQEGGVLWVAGRSDWNCKCMKWIVETVGGNWRAFLDLNGANQPNWKNTCMKPT